MNLRQIVTNKINEIGLDAAAEYFGKSKQTVQGYLKPNAIIPLSVVEKVMNDEIMDEPAPEAPVFVQSAPVPPPIAPPVEMSIEAKVENLHARLSQLESYMKFGVTTEAPPDGGYGFRSVTPSTVVPPNEAPKVSQVNTAIPSQPVTVGTNQNSTMSSTAYMPKTSWLAPHPTPPGGGRV